MELIDNLMLGFSVAFTPENLLYALLGCVLGTLVGVLPGLGPVPTIAMLLPITYVLPPVAGLIMLAGIYYGTQYGGSTTAILVNLPGETLRRGDRAGRPSDGAQRTRRRLVAGRHRLFLRHRRHHAHRRVRAPPLAEVAFKFGPAEYFSLMTLGLVGAVVLASGSLVKAICMILLGLLLGLVGTDVRFGRGPLRLRHSGTAGRHQLRHRRHGRLRLCRDHEQPGAEGQARRDHGQGGVAVSEPARDARGGARHRPRHRGRVDAGHPARRRCGSVLLCVLHAGKEDLEESGTLRQGPPGRPGWPGIGEQRCRADLVHPAADPGYPW